MLRNDSVILYKGQKPNSQENSFNKSFNQSTTSIRKFHSRSVNKLNRSVDNENSKFNPHSANKAYSYSLASIVTDAINSSTVSDFTASEKENSDPNSQNDTLEFYIEKINEVFEKSKVIFLV
jgi:hypothetical protein